MSASPVQKKQRTESQPNGSQPQASSQGATAVASPKVAPAVPFGGAGASQARMKGHSGFKRENPRSDSFAIRDFDHIEIWCADATCTARRFSTAFGLQMTAFTDIDNGNHKYTSYVLQSETVRFVITAPYWTEAPPPKLTRVDTFPDFNRELAFEFIGKHGSAVRAIGLRVDDATAAYEACLKNGGKGVQRPTTLTDEDGTIVYAEVTYYTDVVLRLVQGRDTAYKGTFMPGYKASGRTPVSYGLYRVDHIVTNAPCLVDVTDALQKMTGMHEFAEFVSEDVGTVDSGLNSMVVANNDETVLLPVNEPTFGTRRKSQIQSFLEHHQGTGVQHIAIHTKDILATIKKMREQSLWGGVEFMPAPGGTYYDDHVPKKMGGMVTHEQIEECRKLGILVDRDEEGGLLQIFTRPLFDRPTLFVEIIQRLGCPLPDGRQRPACGGFGKGNFGALFKSIEDYEKMRDGEEVKHYL